MAKLITKSIYFENDEDFLDVTKLLLLHIRAEVKYMNTTIQNTVIEKRHEHNGKQFVEIRYLHQPRWIDIPDDWFRECCCSECEAVILKSERTEICAECGAEMLKE